MTDSVRHALPMSVLALFALASLSQANPPLVPGKWLNITPPGLDLTSHYGVPFLALDPQLPATLYAAADMQGLWKTQDGGATWTRLGKPQGKIEDNQTEYLDSPIQLAIDPKDSQHLYATQGVRGETLGFWVSQDGGNTWTMPPEFTATSSTLGTRDVTSLAVDPSDFNHILLGSHSAWKGYSNAGLLESKDGGKTWIIHAPIPEFNSGTMGVHFLFDPAKGIGNAQTWLIGTDGEGLWRTENSGATFTRVTPAGVWPDFSIAHGGQSIYYSKTGVLYAGAFVYPIRSTDNGLTWTSITSKGAMPYASYYAIQGDGDLLYTMRSFADNAADYNSPFLTSPESDGLTWTAYQGGEQKFDNGPYSLRFDKVNRILYSANWNAGVWALKVADAAGVDYRLRQRIRTAPSIEFFDLSGKRFRVTRTHRECSEKCRISNRPSVW